MHVPSDPPLSDGWDEEAWGRMLAPGEARRPTPAERAFVDWGRREARLRRAWEELPSQGPRVHREGFLELGEGREALLGVATRAGGEARLRVVARGGRVLTSTVWADPASGADLALALGLAEGRAPSPSPQAGDVLVLLGARTGREGLALDSEVAPWPRGPFFDERVEEAARRLGASIRVGDLEPLGRGGLAAALWEWLREGSLGLRLDLDQAPLREAPLEAWEILRSESRARLLVRTGADGVGQVLAEARKWGLEAGRLGEFTAEARLVATWGGGRALDLPLRGLEGLVGTGGAAPERGEADPSLPPDLGEEEVEDILRRFLAHLRFGGERGWGNEESVPPFLLSEEEGEAGMALLLRGGGAPRLRDGDPYWAAAGGVADLCRRLSCEGAEPAGIAVLLDPASVGEPSELESAVLGIRQACLALEVPVLARGIGPGPGLVLGGVGLVEDWAPPVDVEAPDATALAKAGNRTCGAAFRAPYDAIFLLGRNRDGLGGSAYLAFRGGAPAGPGPELFLDEEFRLQACLREGVRLGLIRSARPVEAGGLLVAVLASAAQASMGCQLLLERRGLRRDDLLFGEGPGRVVVSLRPDGEGALRSLCETHGLPFAKIGVAGGRRIAVALDGQPLWDAEIAELEGKGDRP